MTRPVHLLRCHTKIVATVGPASRSPETLEALIRAGVDIFRMNLSHGSHDDHRENYQRIRAAAAAQGEPVAILADLCGPKVRVGQFAGGSIDLHPGEIVVVTTREVIGSPGLIPSQYTALARDVKPGDRILLDDGLLELRVESTDGTDVKCLVQVGGVLKNRKGMNLPGVAVSSPALTEKDREDARFALDLGVDYLALSFVRRVSDVQDLKTLIAEAGHHTPVIAKIEKPEAMECIDDIIAAADGVMVARGDLGVEMPPEMVPIVQRTLVEHCRLACKPVIVATQMLESMVSSPRPTRAEVSDVSTAVFAGVDAIMLSAETAVGSYPVQAVQMMDRIARQVENTLYLDGRFESLTQEDHEKHLPESLAMRLAIARSISQLSRDLKIQAIAVRTQKGQSAMVVSAARPAAPIVALTMSSEVARRLNLYWGVLPRIIDEEHFAQIRAAAIRETTSMKLAETGHHLLLLSGFGKNEPTVSILTV